ncbi:exocyst complex component 3-like protein 4 isoform X2 [Betta splendens]|uniref:Exocyst complex component 3-like protein 4 isoform X2 n=1 Tax=Betta splendens TaxID=158456 RepID=A0A6P7LM19_BETSP|nr:exocyst complex component 3-like protein 4 isoform X2 [Betta splendens]
MSGPTERADEDAASLKSGGRTPTKDAVKGTLNSLRRSFRRAVEKSPRLSGGKGSKVTSEADDSGSPRSPVPPSPSPSAGSWASSPLKSTEDGEASVTPQKNRPLTQAKTEPDVSRFSESLLKRGESLRNSLGLGSKKVKNKGHVHSVTQSSLEEEKEEKEEQEEVRQEMEETYTLPELPHTPLSVMQINKLIETGLLEEAHLNLLAMRQEFQREREQCAEDSTMELAKKEKDLSLLYGELQSKIRSIVLECRKDLPGSVARIIQEEEARRGEPGGLQGSWMEAWRAAVREGVQAAVGRVPLEQSEHNPSWLAVHLGLLGKAVVEDLENARQALRWSYPPSFKVFSACVEAHRQVIGQHLKELERRATELRDLYALLDWTINTYKSERIMGSVSLQPDIKDENTELRLEENFLQQLKDKYCCRMKVDLGAFLDGVIKLEHEDVWQSGAPPTKEETYLVSKFPMDVWTAVKSNVVNSGKIDAQLEQKAVSACLKELKQFPKRFEAEFKRRCSTLGRQRVWAEYHISYINSFTALQQHMEGYCSVCPLEVEEFRKEVKWLIVRLMEVLEDQFKEGVKPYLRRMMTRKWLTNDDDFKELYSQTDLFSQHCAAMRPPHVQAFADHLHYHVVREYVGQLMKNNYSCKNRKHEKAGDKIRVQMGKLEAAFEDTSTLTWLHQVGADLSKIVGLKNKTDIKNNLEPLVRNYPDFRKKHLVAVLNFRGLVRGREHHAIMQRFTELKKKQGSESIDKSRVLFQDMDVTVNTDCLSNLPFSCLRNLLPD